jgi:pimeloyl-ACP methyl ester carboxylesterase
MFTYAHLHGFGSSRDSSKGIHLRDAFALRGHELQLLDLNVPTFERQTYSAILAALDAWDASQPSAGKLRLIGSSMGGYLAALWAALHPDRVDRLFLLCPGFDLTSRWSELVGEPRMVRWEQDRILEVERPAGKERFLHWGFVEDARLHPGFPEVACPTRIIHGRRDTVVPIELSRRYVSSRPHVSLIEVDDEHTLQESLDRIAAEALRFFDGID